MSFDSYTMKYKGYISHGDSNSNEPARSANFLSRAGKVLAYQVRGRWTQDAPPGGFSSVSLRGYTAGQFLAPNVTSIEIEERLSFSSRWGAAYFMGAACLYDGLSDCGDGDNWYPNIGAGVSTPWVKVVHPAYTLTLGRPSRWGFKDALSRSDSILS